MHWGSFKNNTELERRRKCLTESDKSMDSAVKTYLFPASRLGIPTIPRTNKDVRNVGPIWNLLIENDINI